MNPAKKRRFSPRAAWEREIVKRLNSVFGPGEAYRSPRKGPPPEPDIEAPFFWIDTGHGNQASLEATLERADRECDLDRPKLAICQRPGKRPMVAMFLNDFLELLKAWIDVNYPESKED